MAMNQKHYNALGFTLVELLMVIVIIVLGFGYVGVTVYRHLDETLLRTSGRHLLLTARYARLTASQEHRRIRLHIDLDEGSYWLTSSQSGIPVEEWTAQMEAYQEAEVRSIYSHKKILDEEIHFVLAQTDSGRVYRGGKVTIDFNPNGSSQAGLVQLATDKETMTLLIYPWTGNAQLRPGAVDQLPMDATDFGAGSR